MILRLPKRPIARSATLSARCRPLPRPQYFLNSRAQSRLTTDTLPPRPGDHHSQFVPIPLPVPPPPLPPKRSLKNYIYATIFFALGYGAGKMFMLALRPPPLPEVDTKEDKAMTTEIRKQAEKLPIVLSLSSDPNWISYDAYSSLSAQERPHRLTTGPLGGARGLGGFQRIFYNKESGETVSIVWFGGAIAGWPGVTHGGVTATIMDESLGRCAVKQFPAHTGVTANLELKYLKPLRTNSFYIVRASPEAGYTERKGWATGRIETLDGVVCVEAKGLFVVPKQYKTRVIAGDF